MIINFKNKKDAVTVDISGRQIRYLKDVDKHGEILFHNLSNADVDGYEYLWKHDKKLFKKSLIEDMKNFLGIKINPKNLKLKLQKKEHYCSANNCGDPAVGTGLDGKWYCSEHMTHDMDDDVRFETAVGIAEEAGTAKYD